jgi:hypothetical protein
MYAVYQPHLITKASIMAASPSQLEMLAPHVILVKELVVLDRFTPRLARPFGFNAFNFVLNARQGQPRWRLDHQQMAKI